VVSDGSTTGDSWLPPSSTLTPLWGSQGTGDRGGVGDSLVVADGLRVERGENVLLAGLEWHVRRGEHWLIAGGNGAGKSTLSKLLALAEPRLSGQLQVLGDEFRVAPALGGAVDDSWPAQRELVGWVSTELHLAVARSAYTAEAIVRDHTGGASEAEVSRQVAHQVASWLGVSDALLSRPFCSLSQGEQKMTLIAAAIAKRPAVLVLDEPCQGLDLACRRRVLRLVQQLCTAVNMSLIYVTHHYEEVMPCVTHVLHLTGGEATFCGTRAAYEASGLVGTTRTSAVAVEHGRRGEKLSR